MFYDLIRPLLIHIRNRALPWFFLGVGLTIWWSEEITKPPPPTRRVHVVYWEKWTDFEGAAMRDVVNAYNASQDKIQVDLLTVSGIENKTLMAIAGANPPDV